MRFDIAALASAAWQKRYRSALERCDRREARLGAMALLNYAATGISEKLAIRAAADGVTDILLYDEIGYWGVTAADFVLALAAAGPGPINVRINSPGGDVFDGMAIYNALKSRTAPVTATVDGIAASAASFIALAAGSVTMAETSMMMIHNAWGIVAGDRNDMLETAAIMQKIDGQLAAIYAGKAAKDAAVFSALMDAETWFTATEAKAEGLCDEVIVPVAPAAQASLRAMARTGLKARGRSRPSASIRRPRAEGDTFPPYDPDGDGDNDAAEAHGHVSSAMVLLGQAVDALAPVNEDAGADPDAPINPAARVRRGVRAKAGEFPDYDPDGDGDNDAAEAHALIGSAAVLLNQAVDALFSTGAAEDPDALARSPLAPKAKAEPSDTEREARARMRLRLAAAD